MVRSDGSILTENGPIIDFTEVIDDFAYLLKIRFPDGYMAIIKITDHEAFELFSKINDKLKPKKLEIK